MAMTQRSAAGFSIDGVWAERRHATGVADLFVYEVRDVDRLLDKIVAEGGDNPYGVLLWPAGQAVAQQLYAERARWRGARVVDVGAGVGLVALAAARVGARACALDRDPFARALTARAAVDQGLVVDVRPFNVHVDSLPAADLVIFSDLLYEPALAVATARAAVAAHRGGAEVWVGDPGRLSRRDFDAALKERGVSTEDGWAPLPPLPDGGGASIACFRWGAAP